MIIVLCPYVPHPPTHGGSIRSRVLLDALSRDHEVHLAMPIGDAQDRAHAAELARELGLTIHELPVAATSAGGIGSKLRHWLGGRSEMLARRWHPAVHANIAKLLQQPCDLLVADSSFVLPLLPAATAPLMLFLHNVESAIFARRDGTRREFKERWTRRFEARAMAGEERRALRRAAVTITVSEHDRDLARALGGKGEIEVVPNSVDPARLARQSLPTAGPPRLLFVGGLDYPPNLEAVTELVETHLPVLRAAHPGLTVRLVGRDDNHHGARFAVHEGVEALGAVLDLLPHYRSSHAVYLPIRSGGGTRIKILEAWALGLPVLATAVAAEGLHCEDGVHLRHFTTPTEGAAALLEVLAGQGTRLADAGRALVEARYSHAAAIARIRAITTATLERLNAGR